MGNQHTWCGAHIHGGLASRPARFGCGARLGGARGARWAGPGPAPPWPPNLAPHQSWPAGWPGHHVCGLHTMHVGSPPCIRYYIGIRYRVPSSGSERAPRDQNLSKVCNYRQNRGTDSPDVNIHTHLEATPLDPYLTLLEPLS